MFQDSIWNTTLSFIVIFAKGILINDFDDLDLTEYILHVLKNVSQLQHI